ncbi:MAG: prepilin peptidase [Acetivibrio sp.]
MLLLIMSMEDIRHKEVFLWKILVLALFGICSILFGNIAFLWERALGILPGIFLLFIAWKTKEKIGKGDGLVLSSLGMQVGIYKIVLLLFLALCSSAVFSIVMMLLKRYHWKSTIPFLPFLLLGYIGVVLC